MWNGGQPLFMSADAYYLYSHVHRGRFAPTLAELCCNHTDKFEDVLHALQQNESNSNDETITTTTPPSEKGKANRAVTDDGNVNGAARTRLPDSSTTDGGGAAEGSNGGAAGAAAGAAAWQGETNGGGGSSAAASSSATRRGRSMRKMSATECVAAEKLEKERAGATASGKHAVDSQHVGFDDDGAPAETTTIHTPLSSSINIEVMATVGNALTSVLD